MGEPRAYDNESRVAGVQSRFRWILRPGNDLFLVLNRGWHDELEGPFVPEFNHESVKLQTRSGSERPVRGTMIACVMRSSRPSRPHGCAPATSSPIRSRSGSPRAACTGSCLCANLTAGRWPPAICLQTVAGGRVTAKLVFTFRDGSVSEETAVFSQRGHFEADRRPPRAEGPGVPASARPDDRRSYRRSHRPLHQRSRRGEGGIRAHGAAGGPGKRPDHDGAQEPSRGVHRDAVDGGRPRRSRAW